MAGLKAELREPVGQAENSLGELHAGLPTHLSIRGRNINHNRGVSPVGHEPVQALANVGFWVGAHCHFDRGDWLNVSMEAKPEIKKQIFGIDDTRW